MENLTPEEIEKKIQIGLESCGGMTEFYQAACSKYNYSEHSKKNNLTNEEEANGLAHIISFLKILHGSQIQYSEFQNAIITRRIIIDLIEKMGKLLGIKKS